MLDINPFGSFGGGRTFAELQCNLQYSALAQAEQAQQVMRQKAEEAFQRLHGGLDKFNMRSLMNYAATKQAGKPIDVFQPAEEESKDGETKVPPPIITEQY